MDAKPEQPRAASEPEESLRLETAARPEATPPPGAAGAEPPGSGQRYRVVAGRSLLFDGDGFLWQSSDWSEAVAIALAAEDGIAELGEARWRVIRFLREYYAENGRGPLNRQLAEGVGTTLLGLQDLFPGGVKRQSRRLAGLPNPKNCT